MINFLKTAGQIITGGIGIVDGKLKYRDAEGDLKDAKGYKEFYARFSQSGSNAPALVIAFVNELGDISISRESNGRYTIEFADDVLTLAKTIVYAPINIGLGLGGNKARVIYAQRDSINDIKLESFNIESVTSPEATDFGATFEIYIRVED